MPTSTRFQQARLVRHAIRALTLSDPPRFVQDLRTELAGFGVTDVAMLVRASRDELVFEAYSTWTDDSSYVDLRESFRAEAAVPLTTQESHRLEDALPHWPVPSRPSTEPHRLEVPLRFEGRLVGAFVFFIQPENAAKELSAVAGRLTAGMSEIGVLFSRQLQDRHAEAIETRVSECLVALAASAEQLNNADDLIRGACEQIARSATGIDRVVLCDISVISADAVHPVAQAGPLAGIALSIRLSDEIKASSISYRAQKSRQVVAHYGPRTDEFYIEMYQRAGSTDLKNRMEEVGAWIAVPLLQGPTCLGTLAIAARLAKPLPSESMRELRFLSLLATIAVSTGRAVKSIVTQSQQHDVERAANEQKDSLRVLGERMGRVEAARVIVHNIANILTPLSAEITKIEKWLEKQSKLRPLRGAFARIEELWGSVEDSLEFYESLKSGRGVKEAVDLDEIVARTTEFIEPRAASRGISIRRAGSCRGSRISAVRTELILAFLNILSNSIDALVAKNERTKGISIRCTRTVANAKIVFTDDGIGIEPSHLKRVFQPGFTTKGTTGGTGLGLSHAKDTIENAKGQITVKSRQGKGTDVSVAFPVLE